jgi:phage tail sheath gpL-like
MPVSFNNIPSSWRQPLFWIETDPSMAGYPTSRLPSLLIGCMLSTGIATADVPIAIPSLSEARKQFGLGSMLDGMVETYLKGNAASELWVVPIDEASGAAAAGSITVSTAPTEAGTIAVYIAGRRVQVAVAADDVEGEVAMNIAAAINADLSMPVIASIGSTDSPIVVLTCKWQGVEGNDIDVRVNYGGTLASERMPVGMTVTIANSGKLASGSGTVDLTAAIANLGDEAYEFVGTGFTDSTSLTALETEYGFGDGGRWGWLRELYGHIFAAYRATYANMLVYGPNNNSGVVSIMGIEVNSPTPVWNWAAAYTAKAARALLNDPARPLQTLTLDGCLPAPKHQRFTKSQLNDFSGVGIATQGINGNGVPSIRRESTTYQLNLYGQGDDAYELVTTLSTLAYIFRFLRQAITSKYPRHKLADDGTRFGAGQAIVTPKIIKAELVAEYRQLEFNGVVENAAAFKANLIVERDATNPNRVNTLFPPDITNQLRIFAVLAQFRLQFDRGLGQIT